MSDKLISIYKTSAPLFPSAIVPAVYVKSMKDSIGVDDCYSELVNPVKEKVSDWHFRESDMKRIMPKVVEAFIKHPEIVDGCRDGYLKNIRELMGLLERSTLQQRLAEMQDSEVKELLQEAVDLLYQASYYAEPPSFSLEVGGHEIFKEQVREYLQGQDNLPPGSEFDTYYSSLVNFTERSFVQEIELSMLKIPLLNIDRRDEAIAEHERKYFWQLHDYFGPLLDRVTIEKELEPLDELPREEIERRIDDIEQTESRNEETLRDYLKKYSLSGELERTAQAMRDFGYLYSDTKKKMTSEATVGLSDIVYSIAKRSGVDHFWLRYATVGELEGLCEGKSIDSALLKKRITQSVVVCRPGDKYYEFLNDDETVSIMRDVANFEAQSVSQLKGMPANSGTYTGPARVIVNSSQIGKVKEGDVLVAPHTTVNFVPAMKKAGAIITDIGGITSHAAIVSRELGVPCIVGLKTATTTFVDGDTVEVNANHGVVRKIKKTEK